MLADSAGAPADVAAPKARRRPSNNSKESERVNNGRQVFMKRGRNHQRRRQGANPNRALDSNGPDVRIRGTAQQIYDKYQALARDAHSSGDRVKAENYLQHAEHYWRLLRSMQGPNAPQFDPNGDNDADPDQPVFEQQGRHDRQESDREGDREQDDDQPSIESEDAGGDFADRPDSAPAQGRQGGQNNGGQSGGGQNNGDERRPRRRRPRRHPREGGEQDAPSPEPATVD
jgi:hypothetical protein